MSSRAPGRPFETYLLPAIIAQSMIVGGGYSTGREIVEYAARFGPRGWVAVMVIFVLFSVACALCFEVARLAQAYDFKSWAKELIGPLWWAFDVLMVTLILFVIAVMSAAISAVLQQTVGMPGWVSLSVAVGVVGVLTWKGSALIERVKTIGSVALYVAYLGFGILILTAPAEELLHGVPVGNGSAAALAEAAGEASLLDILRTAVLYVAYNLSVLTAVLFCLHRQTRRRETFTAGLLSGVAMTVPFALTFACLMRFWPNPAVFDADVPWLPMLAAGAEGRGGATLWFAVFGVVAGWTLLETAVGSVHALVDRIDHNLGDLPARLRPRSGRIEPWQRTVLSLVVLLVAAGLSTFGVIDLVARGYGMLAWGFVFLMVLPLFLVGGWKVIRAGSRTPAPSGP